jgi:hypothetical protein
MTGHWQSFGNIRARRRGVDTKQRKLMDSASLMPSTANFVAQ